ILVQNRATKEEKMKNLFRIPLATVCVVALAFTAACGERGTQSSTSTTSAALAPAQKVQLDMASVFPTSLTLIGEAAPKFAEKVKRASGGTIEIKVYEPGALVPGLETIQAVSKGSVPSAWSSPGFFSGTDSAFSFFTTVPFGPGSPEFLAWMYYGGGLELQNEMFGQHSIHAIPCGITPPEASGWFRTEIKSVNDLKGLKRRFFGLGAKVMDKLGVATQLLAPGDIFQALQLGTIDATEFANPSLDQKLGFYQVAKYYYFPGWHQQASILDFFINQKKWDELSDQHKAIIELACSDMLRQIMAEGEATQWTAMKEMRDKHGVKIMRWSPEIMKAYEKAWKEVIVEQSAANPNFKKVYDSYSKFRENYAIWREHGYLN
ncbi:MAG: TRAP transporter substrate-binding protein, partial [Burkholderiales bacterium]